MHKGVISAGLVFISFLVPAFASAATITNVTVNGGSSVQVNPGDNIIVSVTATLGAKEKWKGVDWGINTTGATPTCANTKNVHSNEDRDDRIFGFGSWDRDDDHGRGDQDDRKRDNHTFTEIFIAKAPKQAGLYGLTTMVDEKNRCGDPLSAAFTLSQSIRVGTNTVPPTFAPYSDIVTQLTASTTGTTVNYPLPTATDHYGNPIGVSCSPASASFFATGNNTVLCNATDAWGNQATPLIFTISVLLPADTVAPIIAPHADISVQATDASGAVVSYVTPTAYDDRDGGADIVSCTPASGSTFAIGTTTVTCTVSDAAGNTASSNFNVVVTPHFTVVDTVPPTIAPHADVVTQLVHAADTSAVVSYVNPTATDNVDVSVAVSCTPASGSAFAVGSTTVTCTATDAAGNQATPTTFIVAVYPFVPQVVTLASQPDESYMCLPDESNGWRACYTGGNNTNFTNIDLGQGSGLQAGALTGVTVALDPNFASSIVPSNPFRISVICYTDAAYTTPCSDWVTSNANHDHSYVIQDATNTSDLKHWTADLTAEHNLDGSSPVVFNPNDYYRLNIQDLGVGWPAFGQNPASTTNPQPYWVINGITQ